MQIQDFLLHGYYSYPMIPIGMDKSNFHCLYELLRILQLYATLFILRSYSYMHMYSIQRFKIVLFLHLIMIQLLSLIYTYTGTTTCISCGIYNSCYLQSLNPASLPPSHLQLRVGAPIILLRNLDPTQGLCNGTTMGVTRLGRRCIEVVTLTGEFTGIYSITSRIYLLIMNFYRHTKTSTSHSAIYNGR